MIWFRVAALAAFFATSVVPAALAQFTIGAPTTDWVAVPYGPTLLGDPMSDHQTGQGEADIVGNTGNLATSLSSFYFKYVAGASSTTGALHYRVRVGGDQSPAGYKSVLLIGLDANRDGKLDLFLGVDNSGQSNGIYIWKPGTGLNISPSTTSMESRMPVKKYAITATNYHWGAVDSISSTAGVVLDPTADTALRKDFNGSTGTDYLLSFSIPFADLVGALGAQGITFNSSSAVTYVMGTATQANSFNQDLNGVSGGTSSTLTWGALGVLTQPISPTGNVINVAPVNTVPGARTANGSLAVTGVSVNDPDGNLATVQLTSTNGTLSVSLAGGAAIVAGTNGSANFTLGGTQEQINAALATLGFTPSAGYTGAATVTIVSTDTGGLTDSDAIAVTVTSGANTAPTANPDTATTHSGKATAVNVIANDFDADGNILTITSTTLNSGAGSVSALNGIITYTPTTAFAGTAVIAYSIADGFGGTASSTLTVTVGANFAPVAVNDTANANPQSTIFINVLGNDSDANGDPLTITAASRTSGNGTVTIVGSELQFAAPNTAGTTVLSYTISDGCGGTATASVTVTIGTNTAPVAVNDTAATTAGAPVDINVLANDTDANADPLFITDAVVTSGSGTALAVNNNLRFTPDAGFTGTATITYTIEDGRGGSASAVATVTVTGNSAPVAAVDSYTVSEDATLTVSAAGVLGNDSDPDGNTLSALLVSGTSQGALTLNANGSFTYTPAANFHGADSFTYQASDGSLTSSIVTVSITVSPVNDAPLASADEFTLAEDTTLTVPAPGILGDDSDVDGDALTAVLVSGVANGTLSLSANGSFTYTPFANYHGADSFTYKARDGSSDSNVVTVSLTVSAVNDAPVAAADNYSVAEDGSLTVPAAGVLANDSDADGDALAAVLVSGPSHGTLTLNADGSFTYVPAANYHGPDSFTYKAADGALESGAATVNLTVTPVNDAPVAFAENYNVAEDGILSIAAPGVLGNDSDADGDALGAVLVADVAHGTLAIGADGSFTYTPAPGYHGPDSFSYKAMDAALESAPVVVSITVTPVNDAPVAAAESYSIPQGGTLNVAAPGVLGNDGDPDGDALTTVLVSSASHGALALSVDGSFIYIPAAGYSGPDSFSYRASDGALESDVTVVSISVSSVNSAPVAAADSYTVVTGATLNISAAGVLGNDSDPDGNSLSAVLASNTSNGTLSLNANGAFSYTPAGSFVGADSFTYRATDGSLSSEAVTVTIIVTAPPVANRPPTLSAPTPLATNVSTPVSLTVTTSDPDGDTVTLSVVQPVRGTVTGTGPDFIYTPQDGFSGTDTFFIIANDGRGGAVSRSIKVKVSAAEGTVGNYALHLRNAEGEIAAHLFLTATKAGRATGVLTIGGIRYIVRGFFGGAPSIILPRTKSLERPTLALDVDNSVPGAPALLVSATDASGTYTGRSVRSPYSKTNPAPQAGKYTLIASRQALVLDRTGAELEDAEADAPMVAAALTARMLSTGAVIFKGTSGNGYPLVCSSYLMPGSEVPFYAGRREPGASIQHSTFIFPPDLALGGVETSAPAISGILHWHAGLDRRIPVPFAATYSVLGARYTPPADGPGLLGADSLTLSLHIPSYAATGLPYPYEDTRTFAGNQMPRIVDNVSSIRINFSSGTFITRVQGRVTRPIFGVIIQGEGIHRGLGGVVDFTGLGTSELRPAAPEPAILPE